jgi:putative hydrolase of the HAD superfamily
LAQITAVTFDLWQTLLLDSRELERARAQVRLEGTATALRKFGEEYTVDHLREAYRACYRRCHQVREQNLDVTFREQVEIFISNISPGLLARLDEGTFQEIHDTYADSFFVHPPIPHPDAVVVLRETKEMGLRIGLISNTGRTPGVTFRRYLGQQGMLEYFDALTFSDEVRLSKPANEIFLLTLQALEAVPAQSIHVGDHVQNDVVGAKRSGLRAVWVQGFYERGDPAVRYSEPDAAVPNLALVPEAIKQLAGRGL